MQNTMKEILSFDMIFHYKTAQKVIAEHCGKDFDMIFQFKMAQNLVAGHNEIDFP